MSIVAIRYADTDKELSINLAEAEKAGAIKLTPKALKKSLKEIREWVLQQRDNGHRYDLTFAVPQIDGLKHDKVTRLLATVFGGEVLSCTR